jgi:hypothetical protein
MSGGSGALNLSLLSRGIGEVHANGHEKVEVVLEPSVSLHKVLSNLCLRSLFFCSHTAFLFAVLCCSVLVPLSCMNGSQWVSLAAFFPDLTGIKAPGKVLYSTY